MNRPWSYTFFSDLKNCPHKAMRKHVARDLPREPESEAMRWGITVHGQLAARLDGAQLSSTTAQYEPICAALLRNSENKVLRAEMKLGMRIDGSACDFFATDCWGRGTLDIAMMATPDAWLGDWKTGKVREEPLELELHALLLRANWSKITGSISANYIWLSENRVGVSHDVSDTERTRASVDAMLREAESYGDQWPKRPNPLCGWCPVRDCEHNKVGK